MKVILSSAVVHMKQAFSRSMFRYCIFLNPLCNAILLGLMYSEKSDAEFTLYAILGTSLTSFWTIICFSSAADIYREKYLGTMPVLFTAPAGFKKIIFGKLLGNSLWGLIAFALNIFFVVFFFGRNIEAQHPGVLIVILLIGVLTFVSLGMLMCSAFTLSRMAQLLMNTIEYPLMLLTGMVFPITVFSKPIQMLSHLLSPTWVMRGFELAVYGGTPKAIVTVVIILLILTMVNFGLAYISFIKIEDRCRVDASLEVF